MLYWIYSQTFHCCRRVDKFLFRDDTEPRKELIFMEIPLPQYPWLSISAVRGDEEVDVTDLVNSKVETGKTVTPEWLAEITEEQNVERWEYVDSVTFELKEIASDGLVNEVKPKTD
jgi:hypothetical protein